MLHEDWLDLRMAAHFADERRDFREVWTRPDNVDNFQAIAHSVYFSTFEEYSIRNNHIGLGAYEKALGTIANCGIRPRTPSAKS
jgi:hypothetical protein